MAVASANLCVCLREPPREMSLPKKQGVKSHPLMPPRPFLLLALLLALSGCHSTRFTFTAPPPRPVMADSLATVAPLPGRPAVAWRALSEMAVAASRNVSKPHQSNGPTSYRRALLSPRPRLIAPADTIPRYHSIAEARKAYRQQFNFWGRLKIFFKEDFLDWVLFLTFVGLAAWLVVIAVKFMLTLEVLGIVFGGIPLVLLSLVLFFFVYFFSFFAFVSTVPM